MFVACWLLVVFVVRCLLAVVSLFVVCCLSFVVCCFGVDQCRLRFVVLFFLCVFVCYCSLFIVVCCFLFVVDSCVLFVVGCFFDVCCFLRVLGFVDN